MHSLIEILEGYNHRTGQSVYVWLCECGRKGSGSKTMQAARAGFKKHASGDTMPLAPRRFKRQTVRNITF